MPGSAPNYRRRCSIQQPTASSFCSHTTSQLCVGRAPGNTHAPPTFRGRGPYPGTRLDHILIPLSLNDRLTSSSVDTSRQEPDHFPIRALFQLQPLASIQPAAQPRCGARLPRVQWQPSCQAAYAAAVQADTRSSNRALQPSQPEILLQHFHLHRGRQTTADESHHAALMS